MHGDDFATSGAGKDLELLKRKLEEIFKIKTQMIGEGNVLNRITRYTKEGWEYEADQRHGEVIVEAMNLKGATGVKSPGEESKSWAGEEEARLLEPQGAREYRAVAARANVLSLDR